MYQHISPFSILFYLMSVVILSGLVMNRADFWYFNYFSVGSEGVLSKFQVFLKCFRGASLFSKAQMSFLSSFCLMVGLCVVLETLFTLGMIQY